MNIVKIEVGYEHPMSYQDPSNLDIFFNDEVYMNLDNVLYVTPFERHIGYRQHKFYSIQLIGEHHLFSLVNPFDLVV